MVKFCLKEPNNPELLRTRARGFFMLLELTEVDIQAGLEPASPCSAEAALSIGSHWVSGRAGLEPALSSSCPGCLCLGYRPRAPRFGHHPWLPVS